MNDLGDEEALVADLMSLMDGPLSPLRIGDAWNRIKKSRGESCAHSVMALLTAARSAPGSFDLRAELIVIIRCHLPLSVVKARAVSRDIRVIVGSAVAGIIVWRSAMAQWAVKIIAITGVPGVALLLLYFFNKPLLEKLSFSKVGTKSTEYLVLGIAVGLIIIALAAIIVYGSPEVIRAWRGSPGTTRPM